MSLLDQIRAASLERLARERFDSDLSEEELKVLCDSASSEDLLVPGKDAPRPEIRAGFLRWLASAPEAALHIDPKGLRVYSATIPGKLDLRECRVLRSLDFRRCVFQEKIDFRSAETQGLFFFDSSLAGGMSADRVVVHGPLFLRPVVSEGEIRLLGARIDSNLECDGAKLKAKGNALIADGAQIGGRVFLRGDFRSRKAVCFESEGVIRLVGVKIAGALDCTGAKLRAKDIALSAEDARIGGGVFLNGGLDSEGIVPFESVGAICLLGVEVGSNLMIRGAKVGTVDCQGAVTKSDLIWQRIEKSDETTLNLAGARVKNLRDDHESWLEEGNLDLDGLVYEELTLHEPVQDSDIAQGRLGAEMPLVAKDRIDWIKLQGPELSLEPQPWMQLRELLEKKGQRRDAKYVLFRFRCLQVQGLEWHPLRWVWRVLRTLFHAIRLLFSPKAWPMIWPFLRHPNRSLHTGFAWLEEAPLRICWSIAFTLALGTLIFAGAIRSGAMIETVQTQPAMIASYTESIKGAARKPDESIKPVSIHYPSFQAFIYTLENAVPLVKLGMDDKWMPDLQHQPQPWFPQVRSLGWLAVFNSYGFLVWSRWLLIVSGWVQATVLAAALADRFKK
jgi:hypothetical protein